MMHRCLKPRCLATNLWSVGGSQKVRQKGGVQKTADKSCTKPFPRCTAHGIHPKSAPAELGKLLSVELVCQGISIQADAGLSALIHGRTELMPNGRESKSSGVGKEVSAWLMRTVTGRLQELQAWRIEMQCSQN